MQLQQQKRGALKQIGCAMGQGCPVSEHDVPWYICHVTHSTFIYFICIEHHMRVFKGWILSSG